MSHTVLGSSLDLLISHKNRWLCRSLLNGNRHMYIQMAWPRLFEVISIFVEPSRLTYPNYVKDSEKFLEIMDQTIKSMSTDRGTRTDPVCNVLDYMRCEAIGDGTDDEVKTEAFSLLRAGE